jgi:hypothetical protein
MKTKKSGRNCTDEISILRYESSQIKRNRNGVARARREMKAAADLRRDTKTGIIP